MVQSKTLLVRHLPPNLTVEEREDLLKHFGAINVKVISSKVKKSSLVFATFPSREEATSALHRLHQLDVLGYPLTVEYAKGGENLDTLPEVKQAFQIRKDEKENSQKHYENFLHKLNTWHSSVDFTQPPPAHLRYQYPPPSHTVLVNIMRALASVPKFYTQVLHLMNKMNLPSPFDCIFPEPDVLKQSSQVITSENMDIQEKVSSTEESEIESEEDTTQILQNIVPVKRSLPPKKTKVKRPKFVKPAPAPTSTSKSSTKPEEVFEKVELEPTQRKIAFVLPPGETIIQSADSAMPLENDSTSVPSGFGLIFPVVKDLNTENESVDSENKETEEPTPKSCITSQELASNRISPRDQKHLSVFKNYQPGIPSCRLYIKNLSKQVDERDLHYIYSKYILPDNDEQGSMFDIRLMQEGRMKGQAFVTLQSVKQAQLALNQTNGYILKDKPMVVQFARSAVAKST
ncbi:Polyadenylate-binding protein [Gryllus bimaculatus]|nr:Polyadenylate-binding protein [Gryllus bimaculatus]